VGAASTARRAGRPRRTACAEVRRTQPCCHLCGMPVDLTLPRSGPKPHPLSSQVDEIIPVKRGGSITDPANLRHAHKVCNGSRGVKPLVPWDPGWDATSNPDEVRARCRTLYATHTTAPTIRTW
jgi:5-methylcytosine-specific restriction endonuclease McrA